MELARVINDNKYTFEQVFKGRNIKIEAGKHIEMDEVEANEFLGLFSPVTKNADGQHDPRSYKMLRIERISKAAPKASLQNEHKCMACGYEATSKQDLEEHTDANHIEKLADADVAKERREKKEKTK